MASLPGTESPVSVSLTGERSCAAFRAACTIASLAGTESPVSVSLTGERSSCAAFRAACTIASASTGPRALTATRAWTTRELSRGTRVRDCPASRTLSTSLLALLCITSEREFASLTTLGREPYWPSSQEKGRRTTHCPANEMTPP